MTVEVNTHWHDVPVHGNVILGVGKSGWPEGDWNATALWRVVREKDPDWRAAEYRLQGVTLTSFIHQARQDLLEHGADFLNEELGPFFRARKRMNEEREPYKVWSPGEPVRIDQEAVELKERFTREEDS